MATDKERIAALEEQLSAAQKRLEAADPRPQRSEPANVDLILAKALELTNNDPAGAADLFWAWTQSSSEVRDSLQPLIRRAIEARLAEQAAAK